MMTPQEVANCTFAKSVMGGYNMSSVDDFLDKLTEDYAALYKENAALKSKLKTVSEKLAEYREMEGAMSSTLLTAQKMAAGMMAEAEQKKNAVLADAALQAQARKDQAEQAVAAQEHRLTEVRERVDKELEAERKRLALGQEKLREFIREVSSLCRDQLAMLELLPEMPMEEPPAVPPETAAAVPPAVSAAPAPAAAPAPPPETPEAVAAFAPAPEPEQPAPVADPFASDAPAFPGETEEGLGDTRVLDDLQFGRNYKRT